MRKICNILVILLPALLLGQTTTENFVKSTTYRAEASANFLSTLAEDERVETITYFDGLGRPLQTVNERNGGNRQDLIVPFEYDAYGRQVKDYLPLPVASNSGLYYTGSGGLDLLTELEDFYVQKFPEDFNPGVAEIPDPYNPYSQKILDRSPLNRVVEQGAPGYDWHVYNPDEHTVTMEYLANVNDNVYNFYVIIGGLTTPVPVLHYGGYYPNGSLFKRVTKDENDNLTIEFSNKQGQLLLKRTIVGLQHLDSYYIYDDFGNLTFVLSPEASDAILDTSNNIVQNSLDKLGYQYRYDDRNRLVEKKIPGKGWEYIVYDKLDRVAFTQDANLRMTDHWLFTKYDALGRVAYTGKNIYSSTRVSLQAIMDNENDLYEEVTQTEQLINNQPIYYTNNVKPDVNNYDIYTIHYYDTYRHLDGLGVPTTVYGQPTTENASVATTTQGLSTVTRTRVLETDDWILTFHAYDAKGRVIFTRTVNYYLGTNELLSSLLDFSGAPIETLLNHQKDGLPSVITYDYYLYDQAGRLVSHKQKIGNQPVQRIAELDYDDLGQMMRKLVGGESFVDGFENLIYTSVTHEGTIINTLVDETSQSWPSLAVTKGDVPGDKDGGIQFRPQQNDKDVLVGLVKSGNLSNPDNFYVDFGIYLDKTGLSGPQIRLRVDGNPYPNSSTTYGTYNSNDLFKVERIGNEIKFYRNGAELESVAVLSGNDRLFGKISFGNDVGGIVKSVTLVGDAFDDGLQDVNFKYNVRGWMTDINKVDSGGLTESIPDLFNFKINYNRINGTLGNVATPLYNGNIAQTFWESSGGDEDIRGYNYSYDDANRILSAISSQGTTLLNMNVTNDHDVSGISYDKNGNILTLLRRGYDDNGLLVDDWDDLTYGYDGNQLMQVDDKLTTSTLKDYGFKDGMNLGTDYRYDLNGNMNLDDNKGISNIEYNHLNLPTVVTFNGSQYQQIEYVYDASGIKLQKKVIEGIGVETTISYSGNFKYKRLYAGAGTESLEFLNQPEGYVIPTLTNTGPKGSPEYSNFDYVFQYTDHLGNIRLSYSDDNDDGSIDESSEIIEESNYYPFGLKQNGYNGIVQPLGNSVAEKWKYNGKELNDELDLSWYDYGARNYDAAIGRWMSIDPLSEDYLSLSPYNYVANSPIVAFDPDGRQLIITTDVDKDGNVTINITLEGKIIDLTSNGYLHISDVVALNQHISKKFGGSYERQTANEKGDLITQNVKVNFRANLTIAESTKDIEDTDHVFGIVDEVPRLPSDDDEVSDAAARAELDGNITLIEHRYLRRNNSRTPLHETGHLLGLSHGNGLMGGNASTRTNYLDEMQFQVMYNRYIHPDYYGSGRKLLNADRDLPAQGNSRRRFVRTLGGWKAKYNPNKL